MSCPEFAIQSAVLPATPADILAFSALACFALAKLNFQRR